MCLLYSLSWRLMLRLFITLQAKPLSQAHSWTKQLEQEDG